MYTGDVAPETEKGLLTVAWGKDGKVKYSMGASILIAGQVIQWLRDKINLVDHAAKTSVMAESIPDNGGIYRTWCTTLEYRCQRNDHWYYCCYIKRTDYKSSIRIHGIPDKRPS